MARSRRLQRKSEPMRKRERRLSEKTIKNVLYDIGHFLNWLAEQGDIIEAPAVPAEELKLVEYQPSAYQVVYGSQIGSGFAAIWASEAAESTSARAALPSIAAMNRR